MTSLETPVAEPVESKAWSTVAFWGMVAFVVAYCLVLLGAFSVQFVAHEFPCPLCMVQRYAMMLSTVAILWVVADALRGTLTRSRYAQGLGLAIIAAVAGSLESTRQILLHIANDKNPGYGSIIFGLHLYTWAWITFMIVIVFCSIAMAMIGIALPEAPESRNLRWVARGVLWLFLAIVVANVIATFCLEGFSTVLPDDPTQYRLFHELGF
jgi:disulfide bond formation protein DsbB